MAIGSQGNVCLAFRAYHPIWRARVNCRSLWLQLLLSDNLHTAIVRFGARSRKHCSRSPSSGGSGRWHLETPLLGALDG